MSSISETLKADMDMTKKFKPLEEEDVEGTQKQLCLSPIAIVRLKRNRERTIFRAEKYHLIVSFAKKRKN